MSSMVKKYKCGFILKNESNDEFNSLLKKLKKINYNLYSKNSVRMYKKYQWVYQSENYKSKLKEIINDFM